MPGQLKIEVRGARVHNLKDMDVDVPLGEFVAVAGVSGSGKSSLAMGVLYAEGSRRYLEELSTYSRNRLGTTERGDVDEVRHIPSAVAVRQRPLAAGSRSTVGTVSEVFNVLRLAMSRLGSHKCPNGHLSAPDLMAGATLKVKCSVCGVLFPLPEAEDFSFNSRGACPKCDGTGVVRTVDESTLVPDPDKTIAQGAVRPWSMMGKTLMPNLAKQLGVRIDVPYKDLTAHEKDIVMHGKPVKKQVAFTSGAGNAWDLKWTYTNAVDTVEQAVRGAKSDQGLTRVQRYLKTAVCPECHGSRLSAKARSSRLAGRGLDQIADLTLDALHAFTPAITRSLPPDFANLAHRLLGELDGTVAPILDLGLGYLVTARDARTLSTGESQRIRLAHAVRARTTGVLYVLDEPAGGLHPANLGGLISVIESLVKDANTVVAVDHDVDLLARADHIIEIGPGAGAEGGEVIAQGSVAAIEHAPRSRIAPYLNRTARLMARRPAAPNDVFAKGHVTWKVGALHNLVGVTAVLPVGRVTAVTGVSGAGKSTLILDGLYDGLVAQLAGRGLPAGLSALDAPGIRRVVLADGTPIGKNSRSTVVTYSGVLDAVRQLYAATPSAHSAGLGAAQFSYNNESGWCPTCRGIGVISLDIQFLPDLRVVCPACDGKRYNSTVLSVEWEGLSIADVLALTVDQAVARFASEPGVAARLALLARIGLGYLTLGQATPELSGGEASRLKLMSEMSRKLDHTLIFLVEPSLGLHPDDVRVFIGVIDHLLGRGATMVLIDHDLDLIANMDWVIDMGPGSGSQGGRVVAADTPAELAKDPASVTGPYLARHMERAGGVVAGAGAR
ncbi:MAG: excinuclease ABC subunit UvrA [Bifidobacteriaceae bacterium]|jgi:excinuclease ABC subunit A|nr:excinuclease ABC subunit UvrA [Bifidobacteriaceae bacterium]